MLKKLTIRNFKAIEDLTIEFTPLTVLIGENSCGKSTVLQALDFLSSTAFREIPDYLNSENWNFFDIKSQFNDGSKKPIEFITVYSLMNGTEINEIEWKIQIDYTGNAWSVIEEAKNLTKNVILYSPKFIDSKPMMAGQRDAYAGHPNAYARAVPDIYYQASFLKYFKWVDEDPVLSVLKDYLGNTMNFSLLSPERIREGKRIPYTENIGAKGEALAYYIHTVLRNNKEQLSKIVSDITGFDLDIQTIDHANKVELSILNRTENESIQVDSLHISDGLLRIIAFASLSIEPSRASIKSNNNDHVAEQKKEYLEKDFIPMEGLFLFDEIENGINPFVTEKIICLLRDILLKHKKQVIVTTHSPVILNDFDPKEIVFLWKDKNGSVHSKKFFDTEEMRELLEALNPGEVWINLQKDEILQKLSSTKEYIK